MSQPAGIDPFALLSDDEIRHLSDAVADVIEGDYRTIDGSEYDNPEAFDELAKRLQAICEERGI